MKCNKSATKEGVEIIFFREGRGKWRVELRKTLPRPSS